MTLLPKNNPILFVSDRRISKKNYLPRGFRVFRKPSLSYLHLVLRRPASPAPLISTDSRAPFRFPPACAISRRVIHDANKTSFLPIVHRPICYRGPIRR
ncbi:hypothetical protein PUN28_018674 [Cardiocondyla obscurior]|uniref:Uncharacterized protein n=1 Tax=Cardiocondyla obscurior TaxID=286306 RepID=A0AAW2EHA5_9HYME